MSNFKEKANRFNALFASQCIPVSNDSALPSTTNSISNVSLSSIQFKDQDILMIICSLNYNKAHGYDNIYIYIYIYKYIYIYIYIYMYVCMYI